MPFRLLPILCAAAVASSAVAQVNTERMRKRLADDAAALSFDASAALAAGNTDYLQVGLGGRFDVRRGPHIAFLVGRYDLAETDEEEYVNQSFAHLRYNRYLLPALVGEVFTQVQQNRQEGLETRLLGGAGVRFEVVNTDSIGLAIGLTPMLEYEVLDEALGGQQDVVGRLSTYLSGRIAVSTGASLSTVTYIQPRVDRPEDARLLSQLAVEVALTRAVHLRVRADLRVDSRPPPGVEEVDFRIENGLVVVLPVP
ncbi:DUF481 domain-containing protein [Rubrivirga marina]|uniref:Outer membrane protein beta-barrel domain-containing protein n=1 Tax=Rubrivirga marina TaxID=1196024 RepID=A0A271J0L0_9BACT|nr:DUF481 domain-containing protein [Rubrivirga marina]PAP77036.1 hypothetical protein BSZ37_11645 [Rubrivirga marina]